MLLPGSDLCPGTRAHQHPSARYPQVPTGRDTGDAVSVSWLPAEWPISGQELSFLHHGSLLSRGNFHLNAFVKEKVTV